MRRIEFIYDFASPNAYLVHRALPGIAERHKACVVWSPVLLGGVFKATGNRPPIESWSAVQGKLAYIHVEFERFVKRHGIPFVMNPDFPVNTLTVMRGAVFAQGQTWEHTYIDTVFDSMWVRGQNMAEPDTIHRELSEAGLPAGQILEATQNPDIKQELIKATGQAVDRGVFGSPTMFVSDEMFFGKDSLSDLEVVLANQP